MLALYFSSNIFSGCWRWVPEAYCAGAAATGAAFGASAFGWFGINSVTSATGASPEVLLRLYQYGNYRSLLQHHLLLL
jgi:hypothetical protein